SRLHRPGGGRFRRRRRRQVRVLRRRAAGARVAFGRGRRGLVGGDRDQPPFGLVGGRGGGLRDPRLEGLFAGGQPRGPVGGAGRVAAVVTGVGDDVGEGGGLLGFFEVRRQLVEADVPFRAFGAFGEAGEVDERVAPGLEGIARKRRRVRVG